MARSALSPEDRKPELELVSPEMPNRSLPPPPRREPMMELMSPVEALEEVPKGHKIALHDLAAGDQILKYGISIGSATAPVEAGRWVHLHVMRSNYDERSSHLDINTGAPKDTKYE